MEVDLVVALKSHFTELEVASSIGTISDAINLSSGAKGFGPVQAPNLVRVRALFNDTTNSTFSSVIVK
jgi:hypothetical protein